MKVVEESIARSIIVNLAMMDFEAQTVPTVGSTGSLRSRGYLLGVAEGVTRQFDTLSPTQDEFVTALAATFALTYGPCDWHWALETVDEFQAGNPEVVQGTKLGWRDVQTVYSGEPFASPTGFWLLNNGDEEPIRYNLAFLAD